MNHHLIRKGVDFRANNAFCQHSLIGEVDLFLSILVKAYIGESEECLLLSGFGLKSLYA